MIAVKLVLSASIATKTLQ